MYEKRLLPLCADAAAKDMEFAVTQRSAIFFVKKGYAFFDKLKGRLLLQPAFNIYGLSSVGAVLAALDLEFLRIVGYAMLVVVILYCGLHGLLGQDGAVYLMGGQAVQGFYHCLV